MCEATDGCYDDLSCILCGAQMAGDADLACRSPLLQAALVETRSASAR